MPYEDEFGRHVLRIEQAIGADVEIVLGILYDIYDEAIAELAALDLTDITNLTERQQRLAFLAAQISGLAKGRFGEISATMTERMTLLGRFDQAWTAFSLGEILGGVYAMTLLTESEILDMVNAQILDGAPSAAWWSRQAEDMRHKFMQQVRIGITRGETLPEVVRRIRGKATGKRFAYRTKAGKLRYRVEFSGGIMDAQTRQAEALVRTSAMQTVADTRRATYGANDDIVWGVQQVSTLDARTTPICRKYDGKRFAYPDMEPVGHELSYDGGVPRHWGCRSGETPLLRTPEELAKKGIDINALPGSVRTSKGGLVPANWNYYDWLKQAGADVQREVLGARRMKAIAEGRITMEEAVSALDSAPLTQEVVEQAEARATSRKVLTR